MTLTGVKCDSATHAALHAHLVLGYTKPESRASAGISQQALDAALRRVRDTDAAARAYADLVQPCSHRKMQNGGSKE